MPEIGLNHLREMSAILPYHNPLLSRMSVAKLFTRACTPRLDASCMIYLNEVDRNEVRHGVNFIIGI